jgi:hypothetical protein
MIGVSAAALQNCEQGRKGRCGLCSRWRESTLSLEIAANFHSGMLRELLFVSAGSSGSTSAVADNLSKQPRRNSFCSTTSCCPRVPPLAELSDHSQTIFQLRVFQGDDGSRTTMYFFHDSQRRANSFCLTRSMPTGREEPPLRPATPPSSSTTNVLPSAPTVVVQISSCAAYAPRIGVSEKKKEQRFPRGSLRPVMEKSSARMRARRFAPSAPSQLNIRIGRIV